MTFFICLLPEACIIQLFVLITLQANAIRKEPAMTEAK